MKHGVECMGGKQVPESCPVAHIEPGEFRPTACDGSDPVDGSKPAVAQVIDDEHVMARCQEFHDGVRTDISGTTRYEDRRSGAHEGPAPERKGMIANFSLRLSHM